MLFVYTVDVPVQSVSTLMYFEVVLICCIFVQLMSRYSLLVLQYSSDMLFSLSS